MNSSALKNEPIVPIEFAGKWIVWNENHTQIVASGNSFREAHEKVQKIGKKKVWFDKVPSKDEFFGGMY